MAWDGHGVNEFAENEVPIYLGVLDLHNLENVLCRSRLSPIFSALARCSVTVSASLRRLFLVHYHIIHLCCTASGRSVEGDWAEDPSASPHRTPELA